MSKSSTKDQFSSKIAPGVECYHAGALLFAGGRGDRDIAERVAKDWSLKEDEYEIKEDGYENVRLVLIKDIIR